MYGVKIGCGSSVHNILWQISHLTIPLLQCAVWCAINHLFTKQSWLHSDPDNCHDQLRAQHAFVITMILSGKHRYIIIANYISITIFGMGAGFSQIEYISLWQTDAFFVALHCLEHIRWDLWIDKLKVCGLKTFMPPQYKAAGLHCCPGASSIDIWGRVTHICVGKLTIIVSDNGLSPGRRQAIIWTNAGILLIGP